MRVLGIDYGTVRTGLALSDELGMLASPAGTVNESNTQRLASQIEKFCSEKNVSEIVMGLPRHMHGAEGGLAPAIRELGAELEKRTGKKVVFFEERLTSAEADRKMNDAEIDGMKKRGRVDSFAAAIILQSYLDSKSLV